MMKYPVSCLVAVIFLWQFTARHPSATDFIPLWLEAVLSVVIVVLPLSLGCRLITKRIPGVKARAVDLLILFLATGAFWAVTGKDPRITSPVAFWFRLTWSSWATLFLPFGLSVALFEWRGGEGRKRPNPESSVSAQPETGLVLNKPLKDDGR